MFSTFLISSTTNQNYLVLVVPQVCLFPLNCILVLSIFEMVSLFCLFFLSPLKSSNIQFPIFFLVFPSLLLKNFISITWFRWKVHMSEAQCHIIFCYFSCTVCIVFVNIFLSQYDGQPLSLEDISASLLSDQIITWLWVECVWNGDSLMLATGSSTTVSLLGR